MRFVERNVVKKFYAKAMVYDRDSSALCKEIASAIRNVMYLLIVSFSKKDILTGIKTNVSLKARKSDVMKELIAYIKGLPF